MNREKLIEKGVEKHFDGQKVLFKVESLKEHFDGLLIHESDVEEIDGVGYVKVGDVNFDNATANEVAPKVEEETGSGITYEEAEILMGHGELIALPEWGGFWFKNIKTDEILVLNKEGEITNTPFDEFKERNDWTTVEATPEQQVLLDNYFAVLQGPIDEIDVIGTEEVIVPSETVNSEEVVKPIIEAPVVKAEKPKKATAKK